MANRELGAGCFHGVVMPEELRICVAFLGIPNGFAQGLMGMREQRQAITYMIIDGFNMYRC